MSELPGGGPPDEHEYVKPILESMEGELGPPMVASSCLPSATCFPDWCWPNWTCWPDVCLPSFCRP